MNRSGYLRRASVTTSAFVVAIANLTTDQGRLIIQYGASMLDGCAPEVSEPIRVSGEPGRLRVASTSPGPWSELIWPATLAHPVGVYGLYGPFSRRTILAMAESKPRVSFSVLTDVRC